MQTTLISGNFDLIISFSQLSSKISENWQEMQDLWLCFGGISDLCRMAIIDYVIIHNKSFELILTEDFLKK